MVFASAYAIAVGIGMIGQWVFFIGTGRVPELKSEPWRIGFHLAAELVTSLTLIAGGVALFVKAPWGRALYRVAAGMLLYTAIVSPGYFAQKGEWAMVVMFAVLLVLAVLALALLA
jgi:hypothetical protein